MQTIISNSVTVLNSSSEIQFYCDVYGADLLKIILSDCLLFRKLSINFKTVKNFWLMSNITYKITYKTIYLVISPKLSFLLYFWF